MADPRIPPLTPFDPYGDLRSGGVVSPPSSQGQSFMAGPAMTAAQLLGMTPVGRGVGLGARAATKFGPHLPRVAPKGMHPARMHWRGQNPTTRPGPKETPFDDAGFGLWGAPPQASKPSWNMFNDKGITPSAPKGPISKNAGGTIKGVADDIEQAAGWKMPGARMPRTGGGGIRNHLKSNSGKYGWGIGIGGPAAAGIGTWLFGDDENPVPPYLVPFEDPANSLPGPGVDTPPEQSTPQAQAPVMGPSVPTAEQELRALLNSSPDAYKPLPENVTPRTTIFDTDQYKANRDKMLKGMEFDESAYDNVDALIAQMRENKPVLDEVPGDDWFSYIKHLLGAFTQPGTFEEQMAALGQRGLGYSNLQDAIRKNNSELERQHEQDVLNKMIPFEQQRTSDRVAADRQIDAVTAQLFGAGIDAGETASQNAWDVGQVNTRTNRTENAAQKREARNNRLRALGVLAEQNRADARSDRDIESREKIAREELELRGSEAQSLAEYRRAQIQQGGDSQTRQNRVDYFTHSQGPTLESQFHTEAAKEDPDMNKLKQLLNRINVERSRFNLGKFTIQQDS